MLRFLLQDRLALRSGVVEVAAQNSDALPFSFCPGLVVGKGVPKGRP